MITKQILIGTHNPAKYDRWSSVFSDYHVFSLNDLGLDINIPEGITSIRENAEKKALAYAAKSQLITLSEDSAFYIEELDGLPGVDIKTWGGEFENDLTNEELFNIVKERIRPLKNGRSYIQTAVSIATPNGNIRTFFTENMGYLDKNKFQSPYVEGYPLTFAFVSNKLYKSWGEMTVQEKLFVYQDINSDLIAYVHELFL